MASPGGQVYFCYRCDRNVRPTGAGELVCPVCSEGFLEEVENPGPDLPPASFAPWNLTDGSPGAGGGGPEGPLGFNPWQGLGQRPRGGPGNNAGVSQVMETLASFFQQMHTAQLPQGASLDGQGEGAGRTRVATDTGPPHPMLVFQGQVQNFLGGGNIEIFFDNGAGPRRLPGNLGDYFLGPGLDQLIQQLAENDPNRYGTPPASKSAIEAMPNISISEEHLGTDAAYCAVCKDEFELGTEARQMPCKHMYHSDCILPWLAQHNSCPVCRYEMPTDDPDYDQAQTRGQGAAATSGNGAPGAGTGGFTFWGVPGQFNVGRFQGGSEGPTAVGGHGQEVRQSGTPSGPTQEGNGGGGGGGRRFQISFPWFRTAPVPSQSTANAQAESSAQAGSAETVSSGPNRESSQASRPSRTDEEEDILMSEPHHEELD